MNHRRLLPLAALLAGVLAAPAPAPAQEAEQASPEMRANWVARFHWTRDTTEETQARISEIMQTLADHNFNAVLFQVRGEANVLYPSPYEPWGPQFDWTDPGWDPMQFAIEEARKHDLEFHAYFNTHTLAHASTLPPEETVPQHRYNVHGPDAEDSWVIHDSDGNPVDTTDSYVWLSPGHPDASEWTRKVLMHIVDNYDVDGVHFDRIRTPTGDFSHDPRTLERFEGDGNPDAEEWGDFMRAQITRDLRRIYGDIALRKPHVKITAAPFGIVKRVEGGYQGSGTESYHRWRQDSFGWMQSGVVDGLFPMIYWRIGSDHPFEVLLADFLARDGGRHVYSGIANRNDPLQQIAETRRQGSPGNTLWSYMNTPFEELLEGPYAQPAPLPAMPWKEAPTTAIVAGTVVDESGTPLLDAWVWVEGDDYTYLTGADGFYSVLNLEPGTHTITVHKNGVGQEARRVTVAAGDVHELDFQLLPFEGDLPSGRTAADVRPHKVSPPAETSETRLIDRMEQIATGNTTTLLPPLYMRTALRTRDADERVSEAFDAALADASDENIAALIRAVELRWIHDPTASALDALGPRLSAYYRSFDWQHNDYAGNGGPHQDLARQMVNQLRTDAVQPERRANSGHDPAVRRAEATEEVWDYMEAEWRPIPDDEERMLNRHAIDPYVAMREAAAADGVDFTIRSAHRTRQRAEAGAARAGNPYAVASFSSHSLGLAIDFAMPHHELDLRVSTRPMANVVRMRESPVHKWLFLYGPDHGWYPFTHEPWHWEYNPPGFRETFWSGFPGGAPDPPEEE